VLFHCKPVNQQKMYNYHETLCLIFAWAILGWNDRNSSYICCFRFVFPAYCCFPILGKLQTAWNLKKRVLFHCKPVNQQKKTTIFALILWEEQRLNRFWRDKRCRNSTLILGSKKVSWQVDVFLHRGSQLYFHITWYVLKEEGRTLFCCPKLK
jgi:hypothetical protein